MTLQPKPILPRSAGRCLLTLLSCLGLLATHGAEASRMMLLDGVVLENEAIVVGEQGIILRSSNRAESWERVPSNASSTLTAVSFAPDGRHGWAVGHDALILASADAGHSWQAQYRGPDVQESFLDVLALDERHVIAVGGYGLFVRTDDGGRTWSRHRILEQDSHLNRISRGPTGTLYLAGEHGTLLKSTNDGADWTPIPAPYEGSFYGVLPLDARTLLAHGLRGRLYRSNDDGATWQQVPTPQPVLLAAALRTRSGHLVLGGNTRGLLITTELGASFSTLQEPATAVAELLELPDGRILALGEAGASLVPLPGRVAGK